MYTGLRSLTIYLGASLMRASLPKSSPSCNVVTTPLPWIATSTDPLRMIYHDFPSSPCWNTVREVQIFKSNAKGFLKLFHSNSWDTHLIG